MKSRSYCTTGHIQLLAENCSGRDIVNNLCSGTYLTYIILCQPKLGAHRAQDLRHACRIGTISVIEFRTSKYDQLVCTDHFALYGARYNV